MKNNRLIADFMGNHKMIPLRYDSSWSELMPVVEKIESMMNNKHGLSLLTVHIIGRATSIHTTGACSYNGTNLYERIKLHHVRTFGKTKIEGCHMAVVEFIKLHNEYG